MGTIVGSVIGLAVAVFGFAAMRNPMRFNLGPFFPGAKGYYQRMVPWLEKDEITGRIGAAYSAMLGDISRTA